MMSADYFYEKLLTGESFEGARQRAVAAFAAEGFGILSEIDVAETLRKKIGTEFPPYVILGACNPHLAHRALQSEPQIGVLLPCNIVIQKTDVGMLVSAANPCAMFGIIRNPDLEPVVREADERVRRAMDSL